MQPQINGQSPMGTHGEEKKDFITIGPITGVNVADLPYSLDQIKEAIL